MAEFDDSACMGERCIGRRGLLHQGFGIRHWGSLCTARILKGVLCWLDTENAAYERSQTGIRSRDFERAKWIAGQLANRVTIKVRLEHSPLRTRDSGPSKALERL
jgi:hypothetical protein